NLLGARDRSPRHHGITNTRSQKIVTFENNGVWLALGASTIALGALWQMWIEAGEQRARLSPLLDALADLTDEQRALVAASQNVSPLNFLKRRRISKAVQADTFSLLTDSEKQLLRWSDQAGWAWALVCAGSLASAAGAFLSL